MKKMVLLSFALLLFAMVPVRAQAQFTLLGDLPGGVEGLDGNDITSYANGVSADGLVVVGVGTSNNAYQEAFRWTQASGMVGLGDLTPGDGFNSSALGVSADGSVLVGGVDNFDFTLLPINTYQEAFMMRLSAGAPVQPVPTLGGGGMGLLALGVLLVALTVLARRRWAWFGNF